MRSDVKHITMTSSVSHKTSYCCCELMIKSTAHKIKEQFLLFNEKSEKMLIMNVIILLINN